MKDFCIVGSGIAGSTIANLLAKNYSVEVFDKARGPGGRASNRRYKSNLSFDHGLQYFSAKSVEFKKILINLKKKKILKDWPGAHLDFTFKNKKISTKFIGIKGNNDFCKYLITGINTNYQSTVTNISFNSKFWTLTINGKNKLYFKYLILTCPFPQLKLLASKYLRKEIINLKVNMVPNITVMVAFKNYKSLNINSIKFNDEIITWACQENSKNRFKCNENLWTIQCSEKFSKKIINLYKKNKNKYQSIILKKFEQLLGFKTKNATFKNIHGWKYSSSNSITSSKYIWNEKCNLGVCGDWFIGPKGENAWQSAKNLYFRVKKKPS